MRWRLVYRIYRNFAIFFHLGIFVMVFLAIYPVAVRDVDILSVGEASWSFDGRNVTIDVPVKVKNGGFYDINDLNLYLKVRNKSYNFINVNENLGNINSGTIKTIHIKIPIDLQRIYNLEVPNFYHFWNYDTFHIDFRVKLRYLLNMIEFNSVFVSDETWEPIIKDFYTYHPSIMEESGGKMRLVLPYTIVTAHYLWGSASFSGKVYGIDNIGEFNTKFNLGGKYDGKLFLDFNATAAKSLITRSQTLHLSGNITFMGFRIPLNTEYRWGAPLNNLHIEVLNNGTLHYSFENDADFPINLTVRKDYYYNGTLVYSETSHVSANSGESVDRYEKISIAQPVDRVIITIHDENTGFTYQEVVNL